MRLLNHALNAFCLVSGGMAICLANFDLLAGKHFLMCFQMLNATLSLTLFLHWTEQARARA